jgi:hypothetical protein
VADVFGEGRDVLGAFIADAGDLVLVAEDALGAFVAGRARVWFEAGVDEHGVGDAAAGGEKESALALDLVRVWASEVIDVDSKSREGDHAEGDGTDLVWTEVQENRKVRHGSDDEHS